MIDKTFDRCHACGSPGYPYEADYYWQQRLIPDTYQCRICEHIFRYYRGDVETYHREKYRTKGEEGHAMYSAEERYRYIDKFLGAVTPFLKKEFEALEIGSGDGLFAVRAKEHVKKVVCSDIDTKMTDKCSKLGFEIINESVLNIDQKFDVIIGMDVLEHVLNLRGFKEKMSQIVNKLLILQVPINRTMVAPNPIFDGHSHYFSKDSILRLFDDDFRALQIYFGNRGSLARGEEMLCIWEKRKI